ncbi:MAG TPA: LytTR family DNA-binding domain-containing protein [Gammaproteobacteria bacterium]|jgi:two-component system LytT family response regulator
MMKISAIIVDDETHAREALKHLLDAYPQIDIVAECDNGLKAVKAVHDFSPQAMFLDIHMPKLDGFDVLELLADTAPLTVFVTAHDEYAIQAFEANALDYLLKPVSRGRLDKTVERLEKLFSQGSGDPPDAAHLDSLLQRHKETQAPLSRILVREHGDVHVIPTGNIIAIEAADDYVVIHTPAKNFIKQERLNNLENLLDDRLFCRIHRSAIINLDYLAGVETEGKDSRYARMKNNSQFSISRSGYAKLIKIL